MTRERSSVFTKSQISELANRVLASKPNEIVKFRILRDGLRLSAESREISALKLQLAQLHWVKELAQEQQSDGSWGRFHSADAKNKKKFPSSEIAIRRALALGLERDNPILARAIKYMQAVLDGKVTWLDRVEKAEGWPICVEAISAGTLAQVDPFHPAIDKAWEYWAEIAQRSFSTGQYDQQSEVRAHRETRGLKIVYLRSRYVLTLLGSRSKQLSIQLERHIGNWIWNNPDGIGYLGADLKKPIPYHINQWLDSLEILSNFQCWREYAGEAMEWLWEQRRPDGFWDFGTRVSQTFYFPLSDNWRKPKYRQADYSTRALILLRKYVD